MPVSNPSSLGRAGKRAWEEIARSKHMHGTCHAKTFSYLGFYEPAWQPLSFAPEVPQLVTGVQGTRL